ncbi:DUF3014 domain-containing protein [Melittangium boletus]|uniref:DUF3014 domain-containing protein n=1 Tax=Melittangium boletus TaxID=83453 RepID=UPI001FE59D0F|nr:DUF3014 domain-containing protein [Melittangium boletus]
MSEPNWQLPSEVPSGAPSPKPTPSRTPLIVGVAVVVVLLGAGLAYFWMGPKAPLPQQSAPVPPVAAAPDASTAEDTSAGEQVPVAQSDTRVRDLVGLLSAQPELQQWLSSTEDLMRRFTSAVSNIAEGESPRAALAFMAPKGAFQTVERGGRLFIRPESFSRYDAVARVIASLDTQTSAITYQALKPLFQGAFQEISRPGQSFDQTLSNAIQLILDTPVPEGDVEVVDSPGVNFTFAAPELEGLRPAQKHLLRMGPSNTRALQEKLRELRTALLLPAATPR